MAALMIRVLRSSLCVALAIGATAACAGSTQPQPQPSPKPEASNASAPPEATPSADASASAEPEPSAAAPAAPAAPAAASAAAPLPPLPPAPPLNDVTGAAAIIWIPDPKAIGGFRSAWIEPGLGMAAERKEAILVGSTQLWALATKKRRTTLCDCATCVIEPAVRCGKRKPHELDEPYLRGLGTGATVEPWRGAFVQNSSCESDQTVTVELAGGVGPFVFAITHRETDGCTWAHGSFDDQPGVFDLDTGAAVKLAAPRPVRELLRARAKVEIVEQDCMLNPDESPTAYTATASYDATGALHGRYSFWMGAPYSCGLGPGHYSVLSEQASDWLPKELAARGRVPAWVAAFLSSAHARHAFMISAARQQAARAEFGKT